MYLTNHDIQWAVENGTLIIDPPPGSFPDGGYDNSSVNLHLGKIESAAVWDIKKFREEMQHSGSEPELRLGGFNWQGFSTKYLMPVSEAEKDDDKKPTSVFRRGQEIVIRPNGFLLWATEEVVGTPVANPQYICFVNAKSTKARTGLMVHFTAPMIEAGWSGNITLEIINLGPFNFVLRPGDVIAQITVAKITSTPNLTLRKLASQTINQVHPSGRAK